MKTKLLITALLFGALSINAQTTHNLNWFTGIGSDVDLTITSGDTVIWTWTNPNHTVENVPGSSVETFDSGLLGPTGSTFEYTFTVVGDNDYFCGVHGAVSMSGTITVEENLGIDDEKIKTFSIGSNPVENDLNINFSQNLTDGQVLIYDMLGKEIIIENIKNATYVTIDVSPLNTGIYLVKIISEGNSFTQRFVKN